MFSLLRQNQQIYKISKHLHTTNIKNGYIVLVPEIGEDAHAADGILKPDGLPAFNDITIENCLGAIGQQAVALENAVKRAEKTISKNDGKIDTHNIFRDLDEATGPLDTTWGIAKALYLGNCTLIPTKSYMNIHERARSARASKFSSKIIYEAIQAQSASQQGSTAKGDELRLLEKYLLEGKLNGLTISTEQRDELRELLSHLGKERANFKNKVNMAVHTFAHVISDYNLVRDFPPTLLEATAKDPNQSTQGPWKITLQPQIVDGFLKYCPDRTQRWNVWQANVRKASGQLEKSLENSTHLEKIRALRKRQANILGYPTFTAMSMQTKMAGSVDRVTENFAKLLQYAGPAQSVEIEQLQTFATDAGFQHKLDLYDVAYWQRKYLISQHHIDEESLREYFPLPKVITGLFAISEKLFNIKIVERNDAEVWQPAVKHFDVYDCDDDSSTTSSPVGGFYLDCYSKENKYGKNNGWMVSIRNRNKSADNKPLCAVIFNFTPPVYGKPYLLNIEDLRMVFKTFGSAMQHLLTKAAYSDLAGLSNIEWDASQVSSQVMCNFLDNKETLKTLSSHFANDEPLPDDLAANVKLLKTNLAGYKLCQELYMAHLDLELHQAPDYWLDVVKRLWPVYRCMPLDKKDAHPCSMTEIFSGDWAAAQFSNVYSKIIAADISDAFEQNSEPQTIGKRFKETFLASGGSIPTAEVFRRFRGRDPSVEALLKSLNIWHPSQTSGDL